MKSCNRILALILSVLIMVSSMSVLANAASVSDFYDFPHGSWSEGAMTAAVNNDLLKGRGNGSIAPKDYITRAEAVAVINRAFGATVEADISGYTDVAKNSWYYNEIAKAVNMQTLVGVSSNRIDPNGYITRESMLTVLARALVLDEGSASSLSKFVDHDDVSKWAEPLVAAMAERGYVNGNEKGELNPKGYITREEFAQVMHNIFRIYIPKTVTIDGTTYGTTIIRAKDVTLNNVTINGDLIAGDGVGDGNLNLTNVIVTGRILFRGGEGNVTLTNTTVGERVIINDVNGVVNFLNYRAEEPFKNIQENTKATFLNLKVNTGGGGSSTPSRADYKVREYLQKIDGSYSSSPDYTDEKRADYGETVTYSNRNITGFTFDSSYPESVLSGVNKGKLVLKAYYTRNKYKVSYDGYNTDLPYEQYINVDTVLKDKMQETIDKNEEDGYNTEFNTEPDGTGKKVTIDGTKVGTEDITIHAIKTPIEYNITYNLNGGKIEGKYDKTYNVEEEIILPVNVLKSGYTFDGWTDENGAPVTKIEVGTKGNKTFNANWSIVTYTITYVAGENGTMDGVTAKTTYTVEEDKYTLPKPVVTKQDYIFKGWYTNANFTGRPVTVLNPADAENKTYYALIEERTYEQYTIKFDGKTYTITEGEKIGDAVDRNGNKLSDAMDNVTYPKGYEADDFRIKGDDTTVITKDTIAIGDMEIEAAKKAIVYTITYVLNGGTLDGTQKTEYTVEDADYTLPVPEKADYNFLGWFEKADFSGEEVKVLDTADAENKTYYANWKKVTYTITFNGTQYTVEKDAKISEATDKNGNKLGTAMDNVTYPKGYEADGFHIKGNTSAAVTKDTPATGNMEIVAAKKAIVYTITYVLGGGTLDGTEKTEYTVEDADYTLPKPTKAGSTFLGWYENGTKVTKLDTADAENKIYTADWSEPVADVYKITFDGKEYDVTEDKALSTNEELKEAMEEALVKPGYDVSFNTKPDGTGDDIDTSYVPEGDMTIYIIEVAKEYTITYEENGGNPVDDDTYTIEDADITLPVPTRDDYVFRGWYEEADFSGDVVTVLDTADLENKTYYAKWVLDNAVLSFEHEVNGDVVTLKVMLNAIPADIDDIAAMSIRYDFDETKLEYVNTTSNVGEVTAASAGYISWYTTSNYITADTLTAKDNVLFTITFNVREGQYGITEVSYKAAEITASEPVGNPQVAEKYTKESETIDLGTPSQTYTITYVENGGVEIPDGSYTADDADITLPIPTRADYAFKGWYEEADFSGETVTVLDTADAEDKTYYAKWVIETATLGFSSEISGNIVKIYVTLDEIPSDIDDIAAFTLKYKHPDNKLTYVGGSTTFGGQLSSQDGYISWYNSDTAVTSESLKANGNIIATLIFSKPDSASGVETFEYTTVEIVASQPVAIPTIATKYITSKEEVQLDAATYVVTFKGQTYNITAGNALSSNALLVAKMNEAADKTGYTVTFNTKADGSGENVTTAYVPGGSMEVYVVEEAIDYSITYVLDGGELDGTQKTSYTVEDADYTLPTPTKDNYNFLGWYENGVKAEVLDTADAEDKTYTAKWEATEYTITYELDGGALDGTQKTKYTVEDADYTLPTPTKGGYTFLGWYEGSTKVTVLDTADAEDKTYAAKWEAVEYTITYELGGIGELPATAKTTYTVNELPYTLPTLSHTDDYTFEGWVDINGNPVTAIAAGTTGNLTFTATWEEIPEGSYTITYDLGGIGTLPAGIKTTYKTSELPYGLPVLDDTADYTFEGWVDANGNPVTAIIAGTTGDLVFTAVWEEKAVPEDEYTITYELGGIGELPATAKTTYKTSELPCALPVLEHTTTHTFEGWKDVNGNFVTEIVAGTTGDLVFTAIWEEIPEDAYVITYVTNGGVLDGTQKTSYTASQLPYTLPVPQKGEVPFLGWYEDEACTGEAVKELTAGSTGNKTYYAKWQEYTLQFYLGTKISRNKPVSYDGDRGQMIVEHGATLTQADVDRELGMLPSEYKVQEGYVDSDGVVHEIVPELWYQKDGEWTKFVPGEVEVVSDMDIHLFIRFVALQYTTDLQIKGIDLSDIDFSLTVPYDSYTDIGETYLDFLTNAGLTMERVIGQVEGQGYDLYQMAIDKAASKSLVDSDGNIMNPNVPVPLHRIITEERILAEIDKYIANNINNEEFIADILRNDVVVNMLLDDDSIRIKVMEDDSKREQFITDSFIDEMLGDEELVKKIVASDEFKKRFIYNDSTLEYVLDDEELMEMIINDPEFHKILIEECVQYVIDVYFEQTKESPALYTYIDDVLKSREFIEDIESRPELKTMLEDEIKALIEDADADTMAEVYAAIRDRNNTTVRMTVIDVIREDTSIKDDIKAVVQADTELKDDIKVAVKNSVKDSVKNLVKTWILNKIDTEDTIENAFADYIKADTETLKLVMNDISGVDNGMIDDYINGNLSPANKADIDAEIDSYLADEANLKTAIDSYFGTFYVNSYGDIYDDYFDDLYSDNDIFDVAYDEFVKDEDSFVSVFDSYVADDVNMNNAFNTFMKDEEEFDKFYWEFVGEEEQFNKLFERYYTTHVHDVAYEAYHNEELEEIVSEYIWDYTEELVVEYAEGTLETEHPELVDAIDELMHEDVPLALRNAYENNPTLKSKIDNLIETDAIEIIEKYRNGTLDEGTQTFLDGEISSYIDDVIDAYIDGTIDPDMKEFVDNEIDEYMEKLIDDYISGRDRATLGDLIPDYAQDAVDAIKKTDAFKNTINDFVSGNGVRVNEDNLMFVEIIADIIGKYDYEKLTSDFLPANVKKVLDLVGREVAEEYVNKYLDVFCTGINEALDNLNADIDAGIEGTEYKFSTSPATRINYMEVIDKYYTTLSGKLRDKVNSQSKIPVSSNPYAQRIVDMDYFALAFDRTGEETEYKSGYKLKDDVMEYYNNMLDLQILLHDAVTFYGKVDTYTIEDRLDSASLLIGTYANKANDVVMNFIETGELPKGYTLEDILALDTRIESIYNKFEDKIQKGEDLYAEYLDRDYTNIVDLANMSIYSGGDAYKIYQIILENGEDAFDFDDAVTAVFDSPNYHGVSKIEDAMAKVEAKIKEYSYDPSTEASTNEKNMTAYVDGYKGTFESKEIKGYETGTHSLALQRYLRYYK